MFLFFRDVLGFLPLQEAGEFVEFSHQGMRFALCTRAELYRLTRDESFQAAHAGQVCELAFPLDSPAEVDRMYIELLARGASPVCPPADMPWGQRTAFFADPEGNIHEIFAALQS
jgi:uncharacterized glyoxalase superfamily protein PhnB